MSLLSISKDAKTVKGEKYGVLTGILYLAPHTLAGGADMCPHSTPGCRSLCLFSAGHGAMYSVIQGRMRKTRLLQEDPETFLVILRGDLHELQYKARKRGLQPAARLNGTSDYPFEDLGIMSAFQSIQFYDYTKNYERMLRYLDGQLPKNYHLTFSRTEKNEAQCLEVLRRGGTVAVVFSGDLPAGYLGYQVVDGDTHDIRFRGAVGTVVGLKAKGAARKAQGGFVVHPPSPALETTEGDVDAAANY